MQEAMKDNMEKIQTESSSKKAATKKMGIFLGIIIFSAILYSIYYFLFIKGHESTENAYVHGKMVAVTSQVNGIIKDINIQETQKVQPGESLISIDSTDYSMALNSAKSNLSNAVRNYYLLQKSISLNENNLSVAKSNLQLAEKELKREASSLRAGITSQESYDTMNMRYISSKNNYEQSFIALENSKIQAHSQDLYSHPQVASAIESLKSSFHNFERTNVISPIKGTVAQKQVEVGQLVHTGQVLFSVIDLENVWIVANFKETQLKNIKIGNPVEIESDLNGKKYEGVISGISPGAGSIFSLIPTQNATGNWIKIVRRIPVRIEFNPESLKKNGPLPIGTSLNVKVSTEKQIDIPDIFKPETSQLYVLNQEALDKIIKEIIQENTIH